MTRSRSTLPEIWFCTDFEHFAARALVRILPSVVAAQPYDLPQKIALEAHVGRRAAHFGDGAVDIRGRAD